MVDSVVWPLGTRLEPKKALIKKKNKNKTKGINQQAISFCAS